MGGRGAVSFSNGGTRNTSLQNNIDAQGKISLNVSDYQGASGGEIRDFVSQLDYEVSALFNEKDELIDIQSGFLPTSVAVNPKQQYDAMKKDGGTDFMDFHNHPMRKNTIQIFSQADVESYVNYATGGEFLARKLNRQHRTNSFKAIHLNDPNPKSYMVQTQNGSKFVLKYTGNNSSKKTKTINFASAYAKALKISIRKSYTTNEVTENMIQWLNKNSTKYGFSIEEASFKKFR